MGFIIKQYEKNFMHRYDPEEGIPFPRAADYPGLACEEASFRNSAGDEVRYFTYHYEEYRRDKLILFCHGLGPGHAMYLTEISTLCRAGFRVLALDYAGCGVSGGERLSSANAPTRDALELLELLKPAEEIVPVGHSLGGYTALNLANILPEVTCAVVISAFIGIAEEMQGFVKLRVLADRVKRYERKLDPRLGSLDNRAYLASTKDRVLWIHSEDDPVVGYKHNAGKAAKLGNPNVCVITVKNKKHTPQYSYGAIEKMNAWMGEYYRLVNEKKLVTAEEKHAFFADKPVLLMTEQDPGVWEEIFGFIDG